MVGETKYFFKFMVGGDKSGVVGYNSLGEPRKKKACEKPGTWALDGMERCTRHPLSKGATVWGQDDIGSGAN